MLVASPRNQRHTQGEVVGFRRPLRLYSRSQHGREVALQLDAEFLLVEDGIAHMHIAGVSVFDGAPPSEQEVRTLLAVNPGLQAKTLFQELQRRYPKHDWR